MNEAGTDEIRRVYVETVSSPRERALQQHVASGESASSTGNHALIHCLDRFSPTAALPNSIRFALPPPCLSSVESSAGKHVSTLGTRFSSAASPFIAANCLMAASSWRMITPNCPLVPPSPSPAVAKPLLPAAPQNTDGNGSSLAPLLSHSLESQAYVCTAPCSSCSRAAPAALG